MSRANRWAWLLPWLVINAVLAVDTAAVSPAADRPIPVADLGVRSPAGDAIPFAELLGPNGRAVCFAFLHPACPLAREYGPVLNALADEFADDGIRFVGVVCECDDIGEVEAYRREFGITFPIHLDTDFTLAKALDATVTPEAAGCQTPKLEPLPDYSAFREDLGPPDIVVQVHYVRTGKLETDSSRIGIWIEKERPCQVTTMIYLSGDFAVVPPGVTDFRVTGSYTLPHDADLVGVIPHAHQLARWVEIRAHVPGQEQPLMLLRVPQWDYNWQSPYDLVKPMRFPAGTRFEAECAYDNSTGNPRNPFDPARNVWHNETIDDEMLLPMFTFVSEKPLDPKGDSFRKFYFSIVRSRFLRRLVDHRYKYVADSQGTVRISPDYDPDDHRH